MQKNLGFTLIELLVVISIIGLLATFAIVSLQNTRVKARDTRRIADLKQVRTIFENYIINNGNVPGGGQLCYRSSNSGEWASLKTILGANLPLDPSNSGDYRYAYFRSDYAPDGCGASPQCGWLMAKREKDNYVVLMAFHKGVHSAYTAASSWYTNWGNNCAGVAWSGVVEY